MGAPKGNANAAGPQKDHKASTEVDGSGYARLQLQIDRPDKVSFVRSAQRRGMSLRGWVLEHLRAAVEAEAVRSRRKE